MQKRFFIVVLVVAVLSSAAFAEEIRIGAGTTAAATVLTPIKDHFEKSTGIKLSVLAVGTKQAIKDLDKGGSDAAMGAHDLPEIAELMKKDNYGLEVSSYKEITVEEPKSYVIVLNKDNPVVKLSKEQAIDIFTGKVTNWKEVGGKDVPIIVVLARLHDASNKHFTKTVLGDAAIIKDILEVATMADVKQAVEANQEAVSYLPATMVKGGIKSPDAPTTKTKPINIFTKGTPSSKVQKLIEYIKGEGQKYVIK